MGRYSDSDGQPLHCSVVQLRIPCQTPGVPTVLFYPPKYPGGKVGRKTCHRQINSQPKCRAEGRCWSFVSVPLFASGETEASSGTMTSLGLQSQREAAGVSMARHPSREPSTLLRSQAPRRVTAEETDIRSHLQPHFPSCAVSRLGFPSGESPKAIPRGQENQGGNDQDPATEGNRKLCQSWGGGHAVQGVGTRKQIWNLDWEKHKVRSEAGLGLRPSGYLAAV